MCNLSGFDTIFLISQSLMEFMEKPHALVMSLIGFFRSWALSLDNLATLTTTFLSLSNCYYLFQKNMEVKNQV